MARFLDKEGRWSEPFPVSDGPGNHWEPDVAADGQGSVWFAWDGYDRGNYDIYVRQWREGRLKEIRRITGSNRFQAHVSAVCDSEPPRLRHACPRSARVTRVPVSDDAGTCLPRGPACTIALVEAQAAVSGSPGTRAT